MTWQQERDLLIAQSMAFVQSVTGGTASVGRPPDLRPMYPSPIQPSAETRPADVYPARLLPIRAGDLRDEIGRRVAAFRARQQAFDRDRNEYCNAMLTKARASSEQADRARDNRPPKR